MRVPGWLVGFGLGATVVSGFQTLNPQERTLDANLYMQTSAEYRAVCVQTYNWATERLIQRLATTTDTGKSPAVVLDLDETVIDNGAFQSYLDKTSQAYSDALWERWESTYPQEVRLIPGAKSFIERAEAMGVEVVYLSNRLTKHRLATVDALRRNGLNVLDINERLYLKDDTSDKTVRRKRATDEHNVLLYIGDNLRDFSEAFVTPKIDTSVSGDRRNAIGIRANVVDKFAYRFGGDWIILPNPVYGEWQKPLGKDARANLRQTEMTDK